jgi:hypothetical protein
MIELKMPLGEDRKTICGILAEAGYIVRVVKKSERPEQLIIFQPEYIQILEKPEDFNS